MNLNLSSPSSPATIVSEKKTLSIPIYQRLFVWGADQIDTLLDDLWISCTHPEKTEAAAPTPKDYHLGVITVHENDARQWEIVDGQQRLTFLTLLGCVLARKIPEAAGNWHSFVWEDSSKKLRLFFHGRPSDTKDITDYVSGKRQTFQNPAFARFAERFDLFEYGKTQEELKTFATYCFEHAVFLVNELPGIYGSQDLNLYFEKMNSTGRQLSPLEVVKGKWFSPYALRWNSCMDFDKPLPDPTGNGDSPVGEKREGLSLMDVIEESERFKTMDGETSWEDACMSQSCKRLVMKPEILALHVLKIMQADNVISFGDEIALDSRKLIETFSSVIGSEENDFNARFIGQLETYRKWIDQNIIYLADDDGKTVYAFRSEKLDDDDERDDDAPEKKRMRQFQSMLYVSSGEGQEWVLKMYLAGKGSPLTYPALRKEEARWHEISSATMRYHGISRYWFWKLDYLLWEVHENGKNNSLFSGLTEEEDKAIRQYVFRQNRSIEHLHPQSKDDGGWGSRENHESAMHRFGNLAMMSAEGNSSQQDDPIDVKFGRVKSWLKSGRLESIKMLLMFHLADKMADGWTVEKAHIHEVAMISLLQEDIKRFES